MIIAVRKGSDLSMTAFTPANARAAAWDEGNRNMRKAGRSSWNAEDFDVVSEIFVRLTAVLKATRGEEG